MTGNRPPYRALRKVLLRVPLLPIDTLKEIGIGSDTLEAGWPEIEPVLLGIADHPAFREALAEASPSIDRSLERLSEGRPMPPAQRRSLMRSLLRYLLRSASRPTPIGLQAGVALLDIGSETTVRLAGSEHRATASRVDLAYLMGLVRRLESAVVDPDLRREVSWHSNTAYVGSGDRIEVMMPGLGFAEDRRASVRAVPPVFDVLDWAAHGRTIGDLEDLLLSEYRSLSAVSARRFLRSMIEARLLHSEFRPSLQGGDPLVHVLGAARRLLPEASEVSELEDLAEALRVYDEVPVGAGLQRVRELGTSDRDPAAAEKVQRVRVDTRLGLAELSTLSSDVTDELLEGATALFLTAPADPEGAPLSEFRTRFLERYEHRIVPLTEVLDRFRGVAIPDSYSSGIPPLVSSNPRNFRRNRFALKLAATAIAQGLDVVDLSSEDLDRLRPDGGSLGLPDSFDVFASVVARSRAAVDSGDFELVIGQRTAVPGALRSFARFGSVVVPSEARWIASEIQAERHGADVLDVELSYVGTSRYADNAALRPEVAGHELLLGVGPSGRSAGPLSWQDLAVQAGEFGFVLWSLSHGKVVRLHSTHLLNPALAPPIVRLVTEMAGSGCQRLQAFDWGPAEALPRLPRVRFGRTVLRLGEWSIAKADVSSALLDEGRFADWLRAWRERWDCPRLVSLLDGDTWIPLDLDQPALRDLLRLELQSATPGTSVALVEPDPWSKSLWLRSSDAPGSYVSEIVAAFRRGAVDTPTPSDRPSLPGRGALSRDRILGPSSEWLTLKLYLAPEVQSRLLIDEVGPFAARMRESGLSDDWFFVRFADPDRHLRVRLHSSSEVVPERNHEAAEWIGDLIARGLCWSAAMATYDREIERYGGEDALGACERLFCVDSDFVAGLGSQLRLGDPGELVHAAVFSLDRLVRLFVPSSATREEVYTALAAEAPVEAEPDSDLQVRAKYQENRALFESLLSEHPLLDDKRTTMLALGHRMRDRAQEPVRALLEMNSRGDLECTPASLVASIAHMHCNRLGLDRFEEADVYRLLARVLYGLRQFRPDGFVLDEPAWPGAFSDAHPTS